MIKGEDGKTFLSNVKTVLLGHLWWTTDNWTVIDRIFVYFCIIIHLSCISIYLFILAPINNNYFRPDTRFNFDDDKFSNGKAHFLFLQFIRDIRRSIEFSYDAEDQYRPIKTRQISLNRRSNLFHFPFRVSSCCASAYASLSKIPWNDFSPSFLPSTPSPSLANAHTHTHAGTVRPTVSFFFPPPITIFSLHPFSDKPFPIFPTRARIFPNDHIRITFVRT